MTTELQIVLRRPFSFFGRVVSAGCLSVATALAVWQGKTLDEIPGVDWIVVIVGSLAQACVAMNAWFSTGASKAREEIENGKDKHEVSTQ